MRKTTLVLAGALAGTLLLAGCGSGDSTAGNTTQADFNDADVTFVTGMRPHHEQAVEMADIVLAADPTPEVAALAERIKSEQEPEIQQLDQMLEHFGADAGTGSMDNMDGMASGDMAAHGGMMTDQQMTELENASGADASRLFLEMMLEHHRGAVEAADVQLREGRYQPALTLAEQIRSAQMAEIDEMTKLLAQL